MSARTWFLNSIVMLCFMDLFMQLPIMGPLAKSLGAGSFQIGLAVGLYSFTNMFGNMAAGLFIDKYGGRRVLLWGLFLTSCTLLLYRMVDEPSQLLGVRFVHGLAGGLLVPSAFTLVSRNLSNHEPGKKMAFSGAAVGLAAIVGPAVSGILKARLGLDYVFLSTAALLMAGWILVVFFAPKDRLAIQRESLHSRGLTDDSSPDGGGVFSLLRKKSVMQSYIGAFTLMTAMGALTFALPLKVEDLGFPAQTAGLMLSTFGVVAILIFVLPINRLFDRMPVLGLLAVGGIAVLGSLLLLSLIEHQVGMYIVMGVYGFGFALLFPSLNKLLIQDIEIVDRGKAFGMFYAFFSLGVVAGSSGIGALTGHYSTALQMAAVFVTMMGAVVGVWQLKMDKRN